MNKILLILFFGESSFLVKKVLWGRNICLLQKKKFGGEGKNLVWYGVVWFGLVTIGDLSIFKGQSDVAGSPVSRTTDRTTNQLRKYRIYPDFLLLD